MYYALTISQNQIITGVHESMTPITGKTFKANPELTEDIVVVLDAPMDFRTGEHILCYEKTGVRKSDLWCIENGYMELPQTKEIIDGVLVDKSVTVEDAPPKLMDRLIAAETAAKQAQDRVTALETELAALKPR
jgi:hypothetical protein